MITSESPATHQARLAYVYVRQSTPLQVHQHQESTERQYRLRQRAVALGWPPTAVEVIDEDQGRSGGAAAHRPGFQRLVAEVGLGQVGLVLMLEASRLARNNGDWHRLIELCGLSRTLLADETAVYDPRDPNDRLLLGVKGTLSEAELFTLRLRLHEGRWHKARKGNSASRCRSATSPGPTAGGSSTPTRASASGWPTSSRPSGDMGSRGRWCATSGRRAWTCPRAWPRGRRMVPWSGRRRRSARWCAC